MIKRILSILLFSILGIVRISTAQTNNNGFFESYIIVNNTYFDLGASTGNPDFEGYDFGSFSCSVGPKLNGFEAKLFKCGSCDVTDVLLFYRIYKEGTTPGEFFSLAQNSVTNIGGAGSGCQNQQWQHTGGDISLYSSLANGRYVFEVYTFGKGNNCFNSEFFDTNFNGNNNFKAYFTVNTPISIGTASASNSVICYGSNASISVNTQSGGEKYYWEKQNPDNSWAEVSSGTLVSTIPSLALTNITTTASYRCRITNCTDKNEAISNVITVSPQRPSITIQPVDAIDCYDNTANFYVGASPANSGNSLTYEWYRKLPSGSFVVMTTPPMGITFVSPNYLRVSNIGVPTSSPNNPNNTQFYCKITEQTTGCSISSNEASLFINKFSPNTVVTSPVCEGGSISFTSNIEFGANRLQSYQWYKNNISTGSVSGANSNTFSTIINTTADNRWGVQGTFSSNFTNSSGVTTNLTCVTSQLSTITIKTRPTPPTAPAVQRCGDGSVSLSATSALGANEIYRWYADNTTSTILSFGTSQNYNITSLAVGTYTYYVSVYNSSTTCESTRTPITVTVHPLPTITLSSVDDICPQATSFNLPYTSTTNSPSQYSISAGVPSLSGFTTISNASLGSSSILVNIPPNSAAGTYQFSISVKNTTTTCSSVPQAFTLTIKPPTTVTKNPVGQIVCEGNTVNLSAEGSGAGVVSYQWRKNGTNISGETSSQYTITSIALTQAGNYDCLIIADCGTATSTVAVITVNPKSTFNIQPLPQTVCREESATFSVSATGTGTLEYRWKKGTTILNDGTNVLGSTTSTLLLTNLQLADAGLYICEVKGTCDDDFVPSNAVLLTVNDLPSAPTVNSPILYCKDATATALTASADGGSTLLWYGMNSSGGISSTTAPIPLTNVVGTVNYYVSQKDIKGCEGPRASISVVTLPPISGSISGLDKLCSTGIINNSTLLTITASGGAGTYSYQWQNIAGNIAGASSNTYEVTNAFQSNTSDTYKAIIVSGACTATTSNTITVTKSGWLDISITGNLPNVCGSGSKELSIVSPVTGATYKWFADASSNSSLNTGSTFTTPILSSSITYYAAREGAVAAGLTCQSNRASATININLIPNAPTITSSDGDNTICAGSVVTLTANGCSGIITWSNGSTTSAITVSGVGTYNATCTVNGCVSDASSTQTIAVNSLPTSPIISSTDTDNTICAGQSINLTASSCSGLITWNNGSNSSVITVTTSGTYNATCTINSCVSNPSILQNIIVNSPPTFSQNPVDRTQCKTQTISFSGTTNSSATLQWEYRKTPLDAFVDVGIIATEKMTHSISVSAGSSAYPHNSEFRLKATSNGCLVTSNSAFLKVNSVDGDIIDQTKCARASTSLDASVLNIQGPITGYQWESSTVSGSGYNPVSGAQYSGATAQVLQINPISSNDALYYKIRVYFTNSTSTGSCSLLSNSVKLNVTTVTAPTISGATSICQGQSTTLTASGCSGVVVWNTSASGSTLSVTNAGTYSAICNQSSCTSIESNSINLTIIPKPEVPTISSSDDDNSVCEGTTITLTANGCNGIINWSSGVSGSTINVSSSGTFNATCAENGCKSDPSVLQTIIINPIPTAPIVSGNLSICDGQTTSLTATSCSGNISWNTGAVGSIISISSAGTYSATCTVNNCTSLGSVVKTVVINSKPAKPTILGVSSICSGSSTTLTATGCNGTITWNTASTGSILSVSSAGTYSATCSENGCVSDISDLFVMNISPLPTISISSVSDICYTATTFTLGYTTITNSPNKYSITSAMPNFVPVTEADLVSSPINVIIPPNKNGLHNFSLKVKNSTNGCESNIQNFSVNVLNTLASGSIEISPSTTFCSGYNSGTISSVSIASSGKPTYNYQWEISTNGTDYSEISGQTTTTYDPPGLTTTTYYRRKVTDACGEVKYSNVHQITIIPDPTASVVATSPTTICSGGTVSFSAATSGGTGTCSTKWQSSNSSSATGTWIDEQLGGATFTTSALNIVGKKYFRIFYDCDGPSCNQFVGSAIEITINPLPTIPVVSGGGSICSGTTTSLTATGCNGILAWTTGSSSSILTVSNAGTYSATCTNICGTSSKSNEIVVNVITINPPTLSGGGTICSGQSLSLSASGCNGLVRWSNGSTGSVISVSPTITTQYTATCLVSSCESQQSGSISVVINQSLDFTLGSIEPLCNTSTSFQLPFTIQTGTANLYSISSQMPDFVPITDATLTASPLIINIPSNKSGSHTFTITLKNNSTGCSKTLSFTTIILNSLLGGSIETSSSTINCEGYNAGVISSVSEATHGKLPYTYQWESSLNNVDFSSISGQNSANYDPPALTQTTYYRRKVSDACGGVKYSNVHQVTITPDPQVNITDIADKYVCSGSTVALSAISSGGSGTCTIYWQISDTGTSSWTTVLSGTSNYEYAATNSSSTPIVKYLRAIYTCAGTGSGSCNQGTSSTIKVTTYSIPSAPTVSPTSIVVCSNQSASLTASGCSGTVVWSNSQSGSSISVNTNGSYTAKCILNTCESPNSNESVVSISEVSAVLPPTVSGSTTICQGASVSLTASGCAGILAWSNGSSTSIINVSPLTTTNYFATCNDGVCTSAASNSATITVNPLPVISVQPQNQSDCKGNSVTYSITAAVSSGTILYQWQRKRVGETIFTDIVGSNLNSLSISNVGSNENPHLSEYRCLLSGTGGCSIISNTANLFVNSVSGTLANKSVCENTGTSIDLTSLSIVGSPSFQWQIKNGSTWTDLNNGNGISGTTTSVLNFEAVTTASNGDYRNKMVFNLVPSGTCTINSDDMILSITSIPNPPIVVTPISYCQNSMATALTATASSGNTLVWYSTATGGEGSATSIIPSTNVVGTFSYYVSQKTSNNCESSRNEIQVIIKNGISSPINTTPTTVSPPTVLTFTAQTTVSNASLLWYNSATNGTGTAVAPSYTASGTYTHWVTQIDPSTGCESPRLQITSVILNPFRIITQPISQADCKGNSVNMSVVVAGSSSTFIYQWQLKKPTDTDFINIPSDGNGITGFNTANLRISSVGNANNPHLSEYRCLISDGSQTIISSHATLHVNALVGALPNTNTCVGGNTSLNLNNFTISGNIVSYQWQTRPSTSGDWTNLTDSNGITGSDSQELKFTNVQFSQGVYYRCIVKFNTLGVICEESSDPARLDVGSFAGPPSVSDVFYCQYANASKLKINNPNSDYDEVWYTQATGGNGTTTTPTPNTAIAGVVNYYVSVRSEQGCESPRSLFKVNIAPQPALPTNTTPNIVEEGNNLTFSANGENLRWYTSPTGTTFTTTAPVFTAVGSYTRYVAQVSQFSCIGPRLPISAAIIPSLKFTRQPLSQADCDGNSVTFSVTSAGYGTVKYQWQRLLPNETIFTNIAGATANSLKIDDVGGIIAPNLTKYRCIVTDNDGTATSSEATLTVNSVSGTFKKVNFCEGSKATLNLSDLNITGKIATYQWQKKSGNSYLDIADAIDSVFVVNEKGTYRCKIGFEVTSRTICSRNTSDVVVESQASPIAPTVKDALVCSNTPNYLLESQIKATNTLVWYASADAEKGTNISPKLDVNTVSKNTYWVSQVGTNGCESARVSFITEVVDTPSKPIANSNLSFCRNETVLPLTATTEPTNQLLWYAQLNGGSGTTIATIPSTQIDGSQSYFVSAKNKFGCESQRSEIKVNIKPCIANVEPLQTCLEISRDSISGNKWFDIFDKQGKMYASINPNGQNLGRVSISIRYYDGEAKTINGTQLLPRYLDFQSMLLKDFQTPVSLKIYHKNAEFEDYKKKTNLPNLTINDFNIVHYDGIREDCGFENNDNFKDGDSYVIYKNVVGDQVSSDFFSLNFDVNSFSENGATANDFTEITYDFVKSDEKSVKGSWKTSLEVKASKFWIQRSSDNLKWITLKEVSANGSPSSYELFDYQPLGGKSYYRIIYIDKDGTKKIYDSKSVEFNDPICQVFPNPSDDRKNINLYLRNINEKEIKLIDILGRNVGVEITKSELGIFKLQPTLQLSGGSYFVVVMDENGKRCLQKIIINP